MVTLPGFVTNMLGQFSIVTIHVSCGWYGFRFAMAAIAVSLDRPTAISLARSQDAKRLTNFVPVRWRTFVRPTIHPTSDVHQPKRQRRHSERRAASWITEFRTSKCAGFAMQRDRATTGSHSCMEVVCVVGVWGTAILLAWSSS